MMNERESLDELAQKKKVALEKIAKLPAFRPGTLDSVLFDDGFYYLQSLCSFFHNLSDNSTIATL